MTLTKLVRGVILCMMSLFVFTNVSLAQTKTITGKVTDSKGEAIPSATVTVKGTKVSTTTGVDGSFRLAVPSGSNTLVISSVGFTQQEVAISGDALSVSLETKNAALNEVVVVGYGTRKAKDATGSVATVTTKDFNKGVIATPDQLIQGRTPGVSVTPSSGEPGAAATINIRGTASIRGNQEPLYVVDGVPIAVGGTTGSGTSAEGSTTPRNPLMFLNPADIESITILKDASSTAIYGSRGANGIIIITTKSGKGKKSSFDFSANTSIANVASRYDLMDAPAFLTAVSKAKVALGQSPDVTSINKGANIDWQDEIFRTAISQNYNLSWGFGRKNTNLRLSGSYDDQQGVVKKSSLKRFTTRANITQKFWNNKLRLDGNYAYSNARNSYAQVTNNAGYQGSLIGAAIILNPTYPIKNADGTFYDDGSSRSPATMLAYYDDNDRLNRFLSNTSLTLQIVSGLSYKFTLGYDKSITERLSFSDPRLTGTYGGAPYRTREFNDEVAGSGVSGNGRGVKQSYDGSSTLIEHTLTYDKSFKGGHVINALAGYGYQNSRNNNQSTLAWGLNTPVVKPTDNFNNSFSGFKNYFSDIANNTRSELQSYFGRVNYILNEKYYLTATVRADGSTRFGSKNKYGVFPAFAAKWRIINEGFAANSIGKLFNDLSLRANYGQTGSQDGLNDNSPVTTIITNPSNPSQVKIIWQGNDQLKWETVNTTGAGVDFAILNSRISGTVDYFFTKRTNILAFLPVPGGFSASAYYFANLPGYVENKGWELSLNLKPVKTSKFAWDVNYNMTLVKNKLKNFNLAPLNTGAVSGQGLTGAYAQTLRNNYPLFTFSMPVFAGFDKDGYQTFANGDPGDKLLGSALPTFFAGLTNTFTYGNLSASVFINTVRGFYLYNNTANGFFLKGSVLTAHNATRETGTSVENPINPGSVSTRFLEKGDFVRISNINLSYAFNVKSKTIRSFSVYASGQNLALFTKYSGLDPEVNVNKEIGGIPSRGFDYAGYPRPRVFTLGVNLGF